MHLILSVYSGLIIVVSRKYAMKWRKRITQRNEKCKNGEESKEMTWLYFKILQYLLQMQSTLGDYTPCSCAFIALLRENKYTVNNNLFWNFDNFFHNLFWMFKFLYYSILLHSLVNTSQIPGHWHHLYL